MARIYKPCAQWSKTAKENHEDSNYVALTAIHLPIATWSGLIFDFKTVSENVTQKLWKVLRYIQWYQDRMMIHKRQRRHHHIYMCIIINRFENVEEWGRIIGNHSRRRPDTWDIYASIQEPSAQRHNYTSFKEQQRPVRPCLGLYCITESALLETRGFSNHLPPSRVKT